METTFWGPSGWKLLHSLVYLYPYDNSRVKSYHKEIYMDFFNYLKYILPCKYCRQSIKNFMSSLPVEGQLNSKKAITKWMFNIHNKVNNKLRRQRYCNYANPSIATVDSNYSKMLGEIVNNAKKKNVNPIAAFAYMGNDFIGSIIYNYRGYVLNCQDNQKVKEINKHYSNFFDLFAKISYLALQEMIFRTQENIMDDDIITKVIQYYKNNRLDKLLKGDDGRMIKDRFIEKVEENADIIEMWYYKLYCIITDKNCTNKKQFDTFFKEHIVNTCNSSQPSPTIKTCRLNPLAKSDNNIKHTKHHFNSHHITKSISGKLFNKNITMKKHKK
jgi:hypothetical protein